MKPHRTGGPDWRICRRSDKSYLVIGPTVLWNLSPKVTALAEYNKIICFNQPIKSHIGKLRLAPINILFTELSCIFCGHWSLNILHSNLKTYIFSFLLFVLLWCRSGEIVVGQADFSSPPDRLSCKVWETFVNSGVKPLIFSYPLVFICFGPFGCSKESSHWVDCYQIIL